MSKTIDYGQQNKEMHTETLEFIKEYIKIE